LYNLGFGDFDPITNQIDDKVVSDNGDLIKVMATVISLALKFLDDNPMAMVFFEGSKHPSKNSVLSMDYQSLL
jgi:hypothetical protein